MSITTITIIAFGSFLLILATGLPVAFTLGGVGILLTLFLWGPGALAQGAFSLWATMGSFVLLAIPLFVLMGLILRNSGLAEALYDSLHLWMGHVNGGLAIVTIAICTLIAAMVGTIGAGILTSGFIALPSMLERKYDKHLAYGSIMAGGALGTLIPPSIVTIYYCAISQMSVGRLFAGSLIPGFILSGLYMLYIGIRCRLNPRLGPSMAAKEKVALWEKIASLKSVILAILLIILVLGSIFTGAATPTEAAAVGCFGAIIITAIYRRLSWSLIKESGYGAAKIFGMVLWITVGAKVFGQLYLATGAKDLIESEVIAFMGNRWFVLITIQLLLILLGMLLDELVIIVMAAPIFLPIIVSLGFDPVWFGVVFIVNMQLGLLTPPYGFALYYMRMVIPEENYATIARSILPFLGLQAIGLAIVMAFPQLALWLPGLLIK